MGYEMKQYFAGLALLLASVWVGGMWVAGYVAVPVLFQSLPDKALAGMLAGRLFTVIAYLGMACAAYLLVYGYAVRGKQVLQQGAFRIIVIMLLLVMLGQFVMQPLLAELKAQALPLYVMDSPFAERFRFWHGASSIVYLIQSLLGGVLLVKNGYQ